MTTPKDHYDQQLAPVYSWMFGTPEAAIQRNRNLLNQLGIAAATQEFAIDLGAGSGFQSIPLAELGYSVLAIDFCEALLRELSDRASDLAIRPVQDDLLNFTHYVDQPVQLIVCMGDTLTHLASLDAVQDLLAKVAQALAQAGKLVLTFRDYVTVEPQGTQRFIPVRSDDSTILTCFLEYYPDRVEVHDLLYRKQGDQWVLQASSYPKLRLDRTELRHQLETVGLQVVRDEMHNGMVCIVAEKSKHS